MKSKLLDQEQRISSNTNNNLTRKSKVSQEQRMASINSSANFVEDRYDDYYICLQAANDGGAKPRERIYKAIRCGCGKMTKPGHNYCYKCEIVLAKEYNGLIDIL